MRSLAYRAALLFALSSTGCSDTDSPSQVGYGFQRYAPKRVDARAFESPFGYALRIRAYADPAPGTTDDELFVAVDLDLPSPSTGEEYNVFREMRLEPKGGPGPRPLDEALPCAAVDDPEELIADTVSHACVDVFLYGAELKHPIVERIGGVVHIAHRDWLGMTGRVQIWAVGIDASEEEYSHDLSFHPLFNGGVYVDVPFDVAF